MKFNRGGLALNSGRGRLVIVEDRPADLGPGHSLGLGTQRGQDLVGVAVPGAPRDEDVAGRSLGVVPQRQGGPDVIGLDPVRQVQ